MAAYGQVTGGYWLAVVIGAVELLVLIMAAGAAIMRSRSRRHNTATATPAAKRGGAPARQAADPIVRCRQLIAEAILVRERVSGQIDAATYRARMHDLASGGRG